MAKESAASFWEDRFTELICCPDCAQAMLYFDHSVIKCRNCRSQFDYQNGMPHLYDRSFRALIKKIEGELDGPPLSEEAVLKANVEFHNENAAGYDEDPAIHHLLSESGQSLIRECVKYCQENTDGQVWIDAGCGTGKVMSIAEKFPVTIGFDVSESMASIAVSKGHCAFLGDAYHIPCPTSTVDVVTACALLHHLPKPEKFLAEAYRVLKPGGMLFTDFDPNNRPSHSGKLLGLIRNLYSRITPRQKSIHTANREVEEQSGIADYQLYFNNDFNGAFIQDALDKTGFRDVRVEYYFDKSGLTEPDKPPPFRLLRRLLMAPVSGILNWKDLAPYFFVLARK